jgi:hypothetical protein
VPSLKCAKPATALHGEPAPKVDQLGGKVSSEHKPAGPRPQGALRLSVRDCAAPINARTAERRWRVARPYIPDEPRRPAHADIERMCAELPYGYWRDATGRLVVFNRRYRPLWQRLPDGTIERANPYEWIEFVEQRWFNYTDARYAKTARDRLRKILQEFFAGGNLAAHTIVTEWELDRPEVRP